MSVFSAKVKSFDPVVDQRTRIIILGSMPGEASLKANQYYAHPQNQFWKLLGDVLGFDHKIPYAQRISKILENGIGMWESLEECERIGSLDSAIKNACPNDIPILLSIFPGIRTICFNGQRASAEYHRNFPQFEGIRYITLPSSSAAHAIPYREKLEAWKKMMHQ